MATGLTFYDLSYTVLAQKEQAERAAADARGVKHLPAGFRVRRLACQRKV